MQTIRRLIIKEIAEHKIIYVVSFFIVLTGIFAGFRCASWFGEDAVYSFGVSVWNVSDNALFLGVFFSLFWQSLLFYLLICFFGMWVIGIPALICSVIAFGSYWSIGWSVLFLSAGVVRGIFIALFFVACCIIFVTTTCYLLRCALKNMFRVFRLRHVPKSSVDIYKDAVPYFFYCLKCYLVSLVGMFLQVIVIFIAF